MHNPIKISLCPSDYHFFSISSYCAGVETYSLSASLNGGMFFLHYPLGLCVPISLKFNQIYRTALFGGYEAP